MTITLVLDASCLAVPSCNSLLLLLLLLLCSSVPRCIHLRVPMSGVLHSADFPHTCSSFPPLGKSTRSTFGLFMSRWMTWRGGNKKVNARVWGHKPDNLQEEEQQEEQEEQEEES